jgi:hypothetical protein
LNTSFGKIAAFFISLAVFVYLVLRAISVPFCNDEAVTFLTFVSDGNFVPFYNQLVWSANNHLLNSLLTWFSFSVFGPSEFALRLPNLVAFVFYAWFVYNLSLLLNNQILQWLLFLLLLIAPHYLLEFFAYSRGYGLSFSFLLGAVYFLILATKTSAPIRYVWFGLGFIVLATAANLALLVSCIIWVGIALVIVFGKKNWLQTGAFTIAAALPLKFFIAYAYALKSAQELYYGRADLPGTTRSIIFEFYPNVGMEHALYFTFFFAAVALSAVFFLIKKGMFKFRGIHVLATLFVGNIGAAVVMRYGMDILYPSQRTALHWLIIGLLLLVFLVDAFKGITQKIGTVLVFLVFGAMLYGGISKANLHVSGDTFWAREQLPESFYDNISALNEQDGYLHSYAAANKYCTSIMAYQNQKRENEDIGLCQSFEGNLEFLSDFCIINLEDYPQMLDTYDTLIHDEFSQMTLLKRKHFVKRNPISQNQFALANFSDEFVGLLEDSVKGFVGKPILVSANVTISGVDARTQGLIIVTILNAEGEQILYKQTEVSNFNSNKKAERNIRLLTILPEIPGGAQQLNVYFWNNYKEEIESIESEIKTLALIL